MASKSFNYSPQQKAYAELVPSWKLLDVCNVSFGPRLKAQFNVDNLADEDLQLQFNDFADYEKLFVDSKGAQWNFLPQNVEPHRPSSTQLSYLVATEIAK
jgi:hypothetical protein